MITPPPKKPIKQSTFNISSFKGGEKKNEDTHLNLSINYPEDLQLNSVIGLFRQVKGIRERKSLKDGNNHFKYYLKYLHRNLYLMAIHSVFYRTSSSNNREVHVRNRCKLMLQPNG